jgi:AbiV family abortive infection protein
MNRHLSEIGLFADVVDKSLRNAETWIKDARTLIENSSFGHSIALLHFAFEEMAKSLVCWYISEGIWPYKDNKVVKDIFRKHAAKNQVVLGMCSVILWRAHNRRLRMGREPSDEEIGSAWTILKEYASGMDVARKQGMYVDVDFEKGEVISPLPTSEDRARAVLKGVEVLFQEIQGIMRNFPVSKKEELRKYFKSWPEEAWKTGKVSLNWLKEKCEGK